MTDQQINQTIAEACGWKWHDHPDCMAQKDNWTMPEKWIMQPNGRLVFLHWAPDYCNDLNAMHDAEKVLYRGIKHQQYWQAGYGCFKIILSEISNESFSATARQRAEAFLRTLGKWEATDKDSLTVGATTEESSVDHLREVTKKMEEVQG